MRYDFVGNRLILYDNILDISKLIDCRKINNKNEDYEEIGIKSIEKSDLNKYNQLISTKNILLRTDPPDSEKIILFKF